MAVQSAAMMYQAGANWQFGKRKISAMTNEEFNPMTFNDLMIKNNTDLVKAIPTMEQAIKQFTPLMTTIIKEFANYINEASKALPDFIQQATASTIEGYNLMYKDFTNQFNQEVKGLTHHTTQQEATQNWWEAAAEESTFTPDTTTIPRPSHGTPDIQFDEGKAFRDAIATYTKDQLFRLYTSKDGNISFTQKRDIGQRLRTFQNFDVEAEKIIVSKPSYLTGQSPADKAAFVTYIGIFNVKLQGTMKALSVYKRERQNNSPQVAFRLKQYNNNVRSFYSYLSTNRRSSTLKVKTHAQTNYTKRQFRPIL